MARVPVALRLPENLVTAMKDQARRERRSVTAMYQIACEDYLTNAAQRDRRLKRRLQEQGEKEE